MEELDLAAMLAPLPGNSPTGTDPREDLAPDALYFRLRDARTEARAAERRADAADDTASAEWGPVRRMAVELLKTRAKDLEVAVWLAEALLRTDDLAGLAAGFELMVGLVERWWDDLHPMPDDEGLARRLAPIAGLNGEGAEGLLIQPLRKVPLFDMPTGETIGLWQYQQSAELLTISDTERKRQRLNAGVIPFEDVERGARAASARMGEMRQAASRALAAWGELDMLLADLTERDGPPMGRVRQILMEIAEVADQYASPEMAGIVTTEPVVGNAAPATTFTGSVLTREDALRVLDEVAEFFRRTEPHSPLAYTLREAVRRGRLTWPELLEEIVPDNDSRAAILSSLGIRPHSSSE